MAKKLSKHNARLYDAESEKMPQKRRSLGQNFLAHASIAEHIVTSAELSKDDIVLEIGPGSGLLTRVLLKKVSKVFAVEADERFFEVLQREFTEEIREKRLVLFHEDIRRFDFSPLPATYHCVSNIPYYITGEILRLLLSGTHQPQSLTLLVQKEVADRIVAKDGKESILSLSVKAYGEPRRLFIVPKGAFVPPPKVDSAVLSVRAISRKNFSSEAEEKHFFELIHAGFMHKRKYLASNLAPFAVLTDKIPEKVRAQDVSLSTWLAFAKEIT